VHEDVPILQLRQPEGDAALALAAFRDAAVRLIQI
jgi:hypothetical protein